MPRIRAKRSALEARGRGRPPAQRRERLTFLVDPVGVNIAPLGKSTV